MCPSSLPLWREERALFLREQASGVYSTTAYFLTVVFFDIIPLRILPPCMFTAISYPLIGLQVIASPTRIFLCIVAYPQSPQRLGRAFRVKTFRVLTKLARTHCLQLACSLLADAVLFDLVHSSSASQLLHR